jgi:hypothetical protein
VQTAEGSADGETAETALGDGGVDDTLVAEAVQQALGDLVGTIVLGDLLTQDEDLGVRLKLLGKSLVQGVSDGVLLDAGALGVGPGLGSTNEGVPGDGRARELGKRCRGHSGRSHTGGRRQASSWTQVAGHCVDDRGFALSSAQLMEWNRRKGVMARRAA